VTHCEQLIVNFSKDFVSWVTTSQVISYFKIHFTDVGVAKSESDHGLKLVVLEDLALPFAAAWPFA